MGHLSQTLPELKIPKTLKFWLPLSLISIMGGVLILMIFSTLIYQVLYLNRVYPGVSVMGIEAGGLTKQELALLIDQKVPDFLDQSITIETGEESRTFTGQTLGVRINATIIADEVYAVGRRGNLFSDMITHLKLLSKPHEVEPLLWYDTGPTNQALQRLADEVYRQPQDAKLIIHPDAEIEVIPAQRGRQLHLEATRREIEAALFGHKGDRITAVTQEIIPAIPNVNLARQQAEKLLGSPVLFEVTAESGETLQWTLDPTTVAGLIEVIKRVDDQGKTQVVVEPIAENFRPHLEEFAQFVYRPPVDASLDFSELTGQLIVLQESQDGLAVDLESADAQIAGLSEAPTNVIKLPAIVTPPTVSSREVDKLGIKELVSESTSYFSGSSAGRMHNIELSASKFQNVVIPPGGIFSFNEHLGEVSAAEGYDESLIIFGDRTAVGIGGGVCQVSTTVFRAAFFGGFEIVERWAHGYRVRWYETNSAPGLDATVYTPSVDFKFRNDLDSYILIKTETDLQAGTLTFKLYGTASNREVIVSEPVKSKPIKPEPPLFEEDPSLPKGTVEQVDWAKDGLDVTVTRIVKEGDQILHSDEIISRYRPWRAVYKVGTGSSGSFLD